MTSPGAQVSGPGALSKRTDTGGQPLRTLPDAKYGENKELMALQRAAPLAEAPGVPTGPPPSELTSQLASAAGGGGTSGIPAPPRPVTPFGAPTERPNEPVTTGAPLGAGAGPMRKQIAPGQLSSALSQYFAADDTGQLQEFAWQLAEMGI